ncbi:hypothetical protein C8Q79DRAFT_939521 [Trametes meyenii]|nr:hypothetical protein C8Q79DRAFT_939521 [Trametes meyenii]
MPIHGSAPGRRTPKGRQNTSSTTPTGCLFTTTPTDTNLGTSKPSEGAVDTPLTSTTATDKAAASSTTLATNDNMEALGAIPPPTQPVSPSCRPTGDNDAVHTDPTVVPLAPTRSSSETLETTDFKVAVFEPSTSTFSPSNSTSVTTFHSHTNFPHPAPTDGTAGTSKSHIVSESVSSDSVQTSSDASTSSEPSSTTTPFSATPSVSSIHILGSPSAAIVLNPSLTSTPSSLAVVPRPMLLPSSVDSDPSRVSIVPASSSTADAFTINIPASLISRISDSQANSPTAESIPLSKSIVTPSLTAFGAGDPFSSSTATTLPWHLESTPSSSSDATVSTSSAAPSSSSSTPSRSLSGGGIAGICVSVVLALLLAGAIVKWCAICRRRKHLRKLEERRIQRQNSIAGESFARLRMSGESTAVTEMASVYDPASIPPTVEVRAPSASYDLAFPPTYPDIQARGNANSGRSLTLLIPSRAPYPTKNRDSAFSQDSTTLPSSTYLDPAMVPDDWTEAWNMPRPSSELMRSGESSQTVLPSHEDETYSGGMVVHAI